MTREPTYPKEGHIFQHKERQTEFSRVLFLGSSDTSSNWQEITEAEYEEIMKGQLETETIL